MDDLFGGLRLFSGLAFTAIFGLLPYFLLGLAIPYAILHFRDSRGVERDAQLGLKAALYFFYSLSILIFLTGLSVVCVDVLRELQLFGPPGGMGRPARGRLTDSKRIGGALMFAGFAFGLLHFIILHMSTNTRRRPLASRVFGGWRMAITGLIVLIAFTLLVVQLFQENMQIDSITDVLAFLFVWTPAWLVDLFLLRVRSARADVDDVLARPLRIPGRAD